MARAHGFARAVRFMHAPPRMRKKILLAAGLAIVALAIGAFLFVRSWQAPLYEPGMVRAEKGLSAPLAPPEQTAGEWKVEPGVLLHHFSRGTGEPVLVIHGGPGIPFGAPIAALAPLEESRTFFYYDQRGCGASTRPIQAFSSKNYFANVKALDRALGLGAQVADIERIRRILGEERITLLGHSFGAFLAALYAAEFPEHVRALVLVAPADVLALPSADGGLYAEVRPLLPEAMRPEYDAYVKRYFDFGGIFARTDAELAATNAEFGRFYGAALETKHLAPPAPIDPSAIGGWMVQGMFFSMGRRHDYRPALARIAAPTLVLHGSEDIQPAASSRTYADLIPGARFEVIEGAGHFVFADRQAAFAEAVTRFLDGDARLGLR